MNLNFLPDDVILAIRNLNIKYVSEIRLRKGQPVIIEYLGEYIYVNRYGKCSDLSRAIRIDDVNAVLIAAMDGSVYAYSEQLKNAFITVDGGVRIGIGGEYVTENGKITAVRHVTSLNIRIPHEIVHCAQKLCEIYDLYGLHSTLLYSKPGLGKTTMLRSVAQTLSKSNNVLVFDERSEISAVGGNGVGYNLGERCDVIRGSNKLSAFVNAIRAMKPDVIITDELYGEQDLHAVQYACDCGIAVIASTHVTDKDVLKNLPFEYFAQLTAIGRPPLIYDKDFNIICNNCIDNAGGVSSFGR